MNNPLISLRMFIWVIVPFYSTSVPKAFEDCIDLQSVLVYIGYYLNLII